MTTLENVLRTGHRERPLGEDWRINDRGEFYQVTTWLDRAWHWLCDVCTNRTAVRTARVFNEIYGQWGPAMTRSLNTAMNDAPDLSVDRVLLGLRTIQYYVSIKDVSFLARMRSVDEAFRTNWDQFVALYPNAGRAIDGVPLQAYQQLITHLHRTVTDLITEQERLTTRLEEVQLQNSQNQEYTQSCVADAKQSLMQKLRQDDEESKTEDDKLHLSQEALRKQRLKRFSSNNNT